MFLTGVIVLLLGGVFGALPALAVFRRWQEARDALGWPTVEGRVIDRRIETVPRHRGRDMERPVVVYTYAVGRREFTGERLRFADLVSADGTAIEQLAPYTPGSVVTVYHHPDRHWEAVLDRRGPDAEDWRFAAQAAAGFFGGAVAFVVVTSLLA